MTPEQHKLVEDLFDRLIQLPPAQRDEELGRQCGDDHEARRELTRLLASADADAVTAGDEPTLFKHVRGAVLLANEASTDSLVGSSIGAYSVLEKLNEGGFGTVYKAEQRRPIQRVVALKVIKPGFDTKEVIARFNSERQALARMDHPNISKVFDAGSTDVGRPYFAMEYVAGRPITQFCDENRLSIKDRLLLFLQVCDAVTHAHQKAIIHRDIKSGNVLAFMHDGKPQAKVIDFGIAKALTSDRLTDLTVNTGQGMAIGTYESMSPEQAAGSPDIDTRSDVYSLGVLLYDLLVGIPPLDRRLLANATDEALRRMIREAEPPSPSERLADVGIDAPKLAKLRGCDVESLRRQLRRELEWIPLKAMRKERERRYPSAHSLAEDIQNYLQGRALVAGPESRLYRFKKSLRRNARVVAAVAGIIFALLLGIVGTTIQGFRAKAAERTARSSEVKALALAEEKRQLAAEKSAALEDANHQLGVAFLETARRLASHGDNFPAAMAAAFAVGFDGDSSGPPALRTDPLLRRDTDSWREAMGLGVMRGDSRLMWRSPATVHHGGPVRCVAFSPNGKSLASASDDETLRLWDLQTGKLLRTFDAHAGAIFSVCFSPDGTTLAADGGNSARVVRTWDVATGAARSNLTGHGAAIRSVCYSPAGNVLASASADQTVYIWNAQNGRRIKSLKGNSGQPNSMAFSPDGAALASSAADGSIHIWDVAGESDAPRLTLEASPGAARGISFSRDGKRLACASQDHTVCLWDLENPQQPPRALHGHAAEITTVCFSPDGNSLASGSLDRTVRLWDAGTGKPLEQAQATAEVYSVRFSGDGKRIAWGSSDGRIHLWDLGGGRPAQVAEPVGEVFTGISFSPDGSTLASASRDDTICLWNAATGDRKQVLRRHPNRAARPPRPVVRVVFSPDGTSLASIDSSNRTVTIWDLAGGDVSRVLEGETSSDSHAALGFSPDGKLLAIAGEGNTVRIWDITAGKLRQPLAGLASAVTSVHFSPDGNRLAAGSNDNDGTICVWDLATGKTQTLKGHTRGITSVKFSPDGATLASGATDNTVRLWDLSSGNSKPFQGHTLFVTGVSFSPDGKMLASSSTDATIRLWDVATGRSLQVLRGSAERVAAVEFSPDGRMLASAAWDGTVSMWSISSDTPRQPPLKGHTQWVSSVCFSPDGATLASGSFDKTVRLWDAQTGETRHRLEGHTDQVFSVGFSPDGKMVASGSQDRTVRLWERVSGKQLGLPLKGAQGAILSLAFSRDGKTLAAGSRDKKIHLWDAPTGNALPPLVGHPDGVYALSYSPDGRILASGSRDPTIRLWDTATRAERLLPAVHTDRVSGLCFSPDGDTLASVSYDHTVCLWDMKAGQPRWRVEVSGAKESRNWMTSVCFSYDGATLASAADDGTVRIWDTATGRQLQALRASDLPVFGVSFSPDGKTLACASNDTTIHLWDVRPSVPLRQYLQLYRFEGLELTPLPAVNLYGDNGFRAQTLDAAQRRHP